MTANEDTKKLGTYIKARRTELGLSLRDLAQTTGLSATFLSSLERGRANPTLDSLRKVSNALSTSLLRMADDAPKQSPIVRNNQRRHISFPPGHVRLEILTPSLTRKMVLFQVHATAEDGNLVVQPLSEPTEECLVVIAGHLRIRIAGQITEMSAGDSVYFQGSDLESLHVIGDGEASYISAVTPPVF